MDNGGAGGGHLLVVATPIGTLSDMSPRALEALSNAELILAEDTRRVRKLLNHFHITTPARALHDHNEAREVPRLLDRLATGATLALVSDAGTPLLADPGFRLVRGCRERGVPVLAVPGPSAVTAALSVAGIAPYPFTFAGFLPTGNAARQKTIGALAGLPHTLVVFLSPHRLAVELAACAEHLGEHREAALLTELSKLHERYRGGTLGELAGWAATVEPRGEQTLVVGPPTPVTPAPPDAARAREVMSQALSRGLPLAEARRAAALELGIPRRALFDLLKR